MEEGINWIESQKNTSLTTLIQWAEVNSWSKNPEGLNKMAYLLNEAFSPIADTCGEIMIPNKLLFFSKRNSAHKKILLGGHMDTVYPPSSSFQLCKIDGGKLFGPGVADMKGGLMVMWLAVFALEKFVKPNFGWEIVISPDEELGSPGSRFFWETRAKDKEFALLFEPSYPDGALVDSRKGSFNFHLQVTGTSAHAGRDFHQGKSAVEAISIYIQEAYKLAKQFNDLSLNAGELHSNTPLNVVAGEAECKINIRSFQEKDLKKMKGELKNLAIQIQEKTETNINIKEEIYKLPKEFNKETDLLISKIKEITPIATRSSGGLSDGNILAEQGLASLDTMGVVGGGLHTSDEYMEIESMVERAKLVFLFLLRTSNALR